MTFGQDGAFKVLVLADCQDGAEPKERMMCFLRAMLDLTSPDLVVFTGDNVIESTADRFWQGLEALLAPLIERGIPYAYTFGNHDDEFGVTKEQMKAIYESTGDCRTVDAAPGITGMGNCVLPVLSADGSRPAYYLWMIDSNTYDPVNGWYDHLHEDQLAWIKATAAALQEQNGPVRSMFFQHIIPGEAFDFLMETDKPVGSECTKAYGGKNYIPDLIDPSFGYLGEFPCPPQAPTPEVETLAQLGGVEGIVCGHDHSNAFIVRSKGIDLIQCPGMSFESYGDNHCRGCRLITVYEDGKKPYDQVLYTCAAYEAGAYGPVAD